MRRKAMYKYQDPSKSKRSYARGKSRTPKRKRSKTPYRKGEKNYSGVGYDESG